MPVEEYPNGFRLFLDLNETFIRTGEVSLEDRLEEQRQHEIFKDHCLRIVEKYGKMELIFMTGNSFEYSRRIEEPLGLKNIPGVELIIVSENGLLARSFTDGELWRCELTEAYHQAVEQFLEKVGSSEMRGRYYLQGNELRVTLKPVGNSFTDEEIKILEKIGKESGLYEECMVYDHQFYFDVDPKLIVVEGEEISFTGKRYGTERLIQEKGFQNVAIGDSASDVPMFEVVNEIGGENFLIGSKLILNPKWSISLCEYTFAQGVNHCIKNAI